MLKIIEKIYHQIQMHHQIKLFDELLLPEKGNYFTSIHPIFSNIEKKVRLLSEMSERVLFENANNSPIDLETLLPIDETTARLSLLELIETSDISADEGEVAYHFDRDTMKRYFTANGETAVEEFTVKSYKTRFKTFANSFYFIVSLAIYSSFCIKNYEKYKGVSGTEMFLHSPLDWTVALYNTLCYHYKCFVNTIHLKINEWNRFLLLSCCICEILKFMIKEIKEYEL